MVKTKHVADASQKVEAYFDALPDESRKICMKLREIVLKCDPAIREDWDRQPRYYTNKGGLCTILGYKKHASLVFFKGMLLSDDKKILALTEGDPDLRQIKFTEFNEVNEALLKPYIEEAMGIRKKDKKRLEAKGKAIDVPEDVEKAFAEAKLLKYFENLAYSHRRDYILWITAAKQAETRSLRISKAIDKLNAKEMMREKVK